MRRPTPTRARRVVLGAGLALLAGAVIAASLWGLAVVRGPGTQALAGLFARVLPHVPPPVPSITLSGSVFADAVRQQEAGRSVAVGIAATVNCDGTSTTTDSDGGYSLRVTQAKTHQCAIIASPDYALLSVTFAAPAHGDLEVNFGPQSASVLNPTGTTTSTTTTNAPNAVCAPGAAAFVILCPVVQPAPGELDGVVTSAETNKPVSGTQVQCWNPSGGSAVNNNPLRYFTAQTDSYGGYSMTGMPADRYDCNAQGDWQLRGIGVGPQGPARMDIAICQARCPAVTYHNGPVMHTYTAYLIFWLPRGYSYDTLGTANFERILGNYFKDVGGTSYYNIATQYWDYGGPIQNSVTLGGTWTDTHAYPRAASRSDPLLENDIQQEVSRAVAANHWPVDMNHGFFVFTGYNAEVCFDTSHQSCSYGNSRTGFCAYHTYDSDSSAIYSEVVDNNTCVGQVDYDVIDGPNGDRVADVLADYVAHEQFESATDPLITAWYASPVDTGEVGDKCYLDLGYVLLNHGHTYYLQAEWSDQINGCAFER
jgi:hypothetical protein